MNTFKNEKRIAVLIKFVEEKSCGFACKKTLVKENGEIIVVQTTRNANISNLEKKYNASMLIPRACVCEDYEIEFGSQIAVAAENSNAITKISQHQEFAQLVKFGVSCRKAWDLVNTISI